MLIDGEKWACDACIRGHRVSSCHHSDRPLTHINKRGKPSKDGSMARPRKSKEQKQAEKDAAEAAYAAMEEEDFISLAPKEDVLIKKLSMKDTTREESLDKKRVSEQSQPGSKQIVVHQPRREYVINVNAHLYANPNYLQKPEPSDSGYHSGLGTDTASVCSMDSVGSSLGLLHDFLQEFIALFGNTLIDQSGARGWTEHALATHPPELIEQQLNVLLKEYTLELLQLPKESVSTSKFWSRIPHSKREIATTVIKFIRRYRPKIARYFRDNAVSSQVNTPSLSLLLQGLGDQLSLAEKLGLFEKSSQRESDPDKDLAEHPSDDECEDAIDVRHIDLIRDYLFSSEPFHRLVANMKQSFYHDDRRKMAEIHHLVLQQLSHATPTYQANCSKDRHNSGQYIDSAGSRPGLHTDWYLVHFRVHWDLLGFLKSQFNDRVPDLSSLVALTGTALYAEATTCSNYLQKNWPNSGMLFLATLQTVVERTVKDDAKTTQARRSKARMTHFLSRDSDKDSASSYDVDLEMEFVEGDATLIIAHGTKQMLVELMQQIAWLGATLSSPPSGYDIAYSEASITNLEGSHLTFDIRFHYERLHPKEQSCWFPLFCGASIAWGFPIAERQNETGLEMPIQMMAAIAGVRHAMEFEGGVVLKGFSSMFVPIRREEDRVQWHLISSSDCETRLPYREALRHCPNRALVNEVSLEDLNRTRAIIGWCGEMIFMLGSEQANYGNIHYSGARRVRMPVKADGGGFGFQQFGFMQANLSFGPKDGKCHFQRTGSFDRIISAAEKARILLYDTSEKRAWLVPASNVILHMAHHQNWLEPIEVSGRAVRFPTPLPTGPRIKDLLLQSAAKPESDAVAFQDIITRIWSILDFLLEYRVQCDKEPGTNLHCTLREHIRGFEFNAVVEDRSPIREKEAEIQKTCGGWPALVRDIDALVLFANGFEDIIRPLRDKRDSLCHPWRAVPKGKDYMATSVKILEDMYKVAGCPLDRTYLTCSHLRWDRGSSLLFEPCRSPGVFRCQCERLQRVVPDAAVGQVTQPGDLIHTGAVIFGQSKNCIQGLLSAPKGKSPAGLYSQPNIALDALTPPTEYSSNLHMRRTNQFRIAGLAGNRVMKRTSLHLSYRPSPTWTIIAFRGLIRATMAANLKTRLSWAVVILQKSPKGTKTSICYLMNRTPRLIERICHYPSR